MHRNEVRLRLVNKSEVDKSVGKSGLSQRFLCGSEVGSKW